MIAAAIAAIAGAAVAALLACIPGLHVYNLIALVVIAAHYQAPLALSSDVMTALLVGMTAGWAMANTIPSVLLAAPDESAIFTVLPGQKYLMRGRGYEGVMLTGAGGLIATVVLILAGVLAAPSVLPRLDAVLRPHTHWMLWLVIAFMLMSEWPKGGRLGAGGWATLLDGWRTPGAGLLTFLLAGLLGFALLYRSPIAPGAAFQNLMPAFVGLFTLPWLLVNLVSGVTIPPQTFVCDSGARRSTVLLGAFAGTLGGGFAAYVPAVTGGVGGLLAGHATAVRDDRVFLVSQGASKMVYYVGALLLFFVPGLGLTRGGAAWMLRGLTTPRASGELYLALAALGLSTAVAYLLLGPLTRLTLFALGRFGYRRLSALAFLPAVGIVYGVTGFMGLWIMLAATGIGLLPVLLGSRRMNCLSVILLPMACNMSGIGAPIASALGLIG